MGRRKNRKKKKAYNKPDLNSISSQERSLEQRRIILCSSSLAVALKRCHRSVL